MSERFDSNQRNMAIQTLLDRLARGDGAARDELFEVVRVWLERSARDFLRRFPKVRRTAQTDDVVQLASLRLMRMLDRIKIRDYRVFYKRANRHIYCALLDLARRHAGEGSLVVGLSSADSDDTGAVGGWSAVAAPAEPEWEREWRDLRCYVRTLKPESRLLFGLKTQTDLTDTEIAGALGVSRETVRLRWLKLQEAFGEALGVGA